MFIGIDQSKRSTAVVAIDKKGNLKDFVVIAVKEYDQEALIAEQWSKLNLFLCPPRPIHAIAIEGLSFNSVGAGKDLLAGLFWYIRTRLYLEYGNVPVGIIPVLSWRCKVLNKEEQKSIRALKLKDGLKKAVVAKLPFEVKARFEEYIRVNGFKKEAIYDLADAYHLSVYRLGID